MTIEKMILIDFDGCADSGVYRIYPANDDSEPDYCFEPEYPYGEAGDRYPNQTMARTAAYRMAKCLAARINGGWATNE